MFTTEEQQEIQIFLALLFPWGTADKDLWKSVTWTFVNKEGNVGYASYAAQSLQDLTRLIDTRANRPFANLYVALGTQRVALPETKTSDGFPKASRVQKNIVSLRSLFMDIDVGKAGAYATTADARSAVRDFCDKTGMVAPTMEIMSGSGGLHVYWCFDHPVPYDDWKPLAAALQAAGLRYELKFDPQVTVDGCRILRVPNTFNHKGSEKKKVVMLRNAENHFPRYSYDQMRGVLAQWTTIEPPSRAAQAGPNQQRSKNESFKGGMDTAPPLSIDDVAVNCPTIDDILQRGGNGDSEPLWNLALLAASFTEDAFDAGHRLSNRDPRYTKDGTNKKLHEKINARANNPSIGWPRCAQFAALHPACKTCPLLVQDKTPFHHAQRIYNKPAEEIIKEFTATSGDPLMPPHYWRNKIGHVLTTMTDKQGLPYTVTVINYPIVDAGLDRDDPATIRFEAVISDEKHWCEVDVGGNVHPNQMAAALIKNGLAIEPTSHKAARDFFVAWVSHLQNIRRYSNQSAYGWSADGKTFAYDDKLFRSNGKTDMVFRGRHHNQYFTNVGDLKPWQDAMRLIAGNMPLEVLVASAFAAPLVELVGSSSLVLSVFSKLSGIGKTTAMSIAQAVWGHPRAGMHALFDTSNAMMKKLGDLKSLPVYWDELRTRDQLEKVIEIIFQVTQGKGKSRLNRDTTAADVAVFSTMFVIASNHGVGDTVYSQTEQTEAGGLRLFEIQAWGLAATMSSYDAQQRIIALQNNYGVAGMMYAEKLAQNRDAVIKALKTVSEQLQAHHKFESKERFWLMTATVLLVGAGLANHWGIASFDLDRLRSYLDAAIDDQRGEMKTQEFATMAATQDVVSLMHEIMSDARPRNLIMTETIPFRQIGQPAPLKLVDTDMSKVDNPCIWAGEKDGRIRTKVRYFNDVLRKRHLNPRQVLDSLRGHYAIVQSKQTIGAGVVGIDALARFGRSECYDFTPLTPPSPSPDSDEQS